MLEKVAPVALERLSTELPEIFGGVAKAAVGAGDKGALLAGTDATALDRISGARWLKLESQSGGHALHITTSPNGDPIFKIAYSSGHPAEIQQFSLAKSTWSKLEHAGLPTQEVKLPSGLRNQEWHKLTGDRFIVEATQFSNKGPLFVVSDQAGSELSRKVVEIATKNWDYLASR